MQVDLLIRDVQVYNSYFKQFVPGNAAILDGRFYYIGQRGTETFEAGEIIEGKGRYMIPGLIDIHLHIESTMVTPQTFSYGLIRNGVTTIVPEPHEMANVFGLSGIKEMIRASQDCVVDMFYAIPSSVPATGMETTGGAIDLEEIDELLASERIICLGEIMNYVDVITDPDCKTNRILRHIRQQYPELIIEGHCPKLLDLELQQFIYAGVDSDHTHQTVEGMKQRIAAGMFIEIQEKSMTDEVMQFLREHDVSEHFCFVTDDVMTDSLYRRGHLNYLVAKAIGMGMSPERAIYAATFAPARRMRLYDRGAIAPNKIADFLLLSDLENLSIERVYKAGRLVYEQTAVDEQIVERGTFPAHFYQSVQLPLLAEADFTVKSEGDDQPYQARVMMVKDGSTFTSEAWTEVMVQDGEVRWQESPYALIATFERYGKNGNRAYGLIGGDILKRGAIATTYSHDNHNLLVIGYNPQDMALAANQVISQQGGFCAVENGKVLANLRLPVGGILTEEPLAETAKDVEALRQAMEDLGYRHYNPIMSVSTLSLPVSPALKITDLGLIDVNQGKVVPFLTRA
ncbi:adenine deaminase [Brevibacillus fulvus]|uniref:Adenine deaminase n=1 Tax=Brevibacillus fulvus TaxID=1125967 RepID=A0A939BSC1_9BACL|nr:adenine deaminase C-terminal domain-containing protein [Brevibacillus fulvus]MBM7590313.1 adenine deaminase [Brevibacillus fulvus]